MVTWFFCTIAPTERTNVARRNIPVIKPPREPVRTKGGFGRKSYRTEQEAVGEGKVDHQVGHSEDD